MSQQPDDCYARGLTTRMVFADSKITVVQVKAGPTLVGSPDRGCRVRTPFNEGETMLKERELCLSR